MTKHDYYTEAFNNGTDYVYGQVGFSYRDGYIIFEGLKIEHYAEDFLCSPEGKKAFLELVKKQNSKE